MALFSKKTKKEATAPQEVAVAPVAKKEFAATSKKHSSSVIFAPRITEKGAYLGQDGVYVFNVDPKAGKREISEAIHSIFKVWPRKVRVVRIPRKRSLTRGTNRVGQTTGGKKAYVYLKKGETIEVV
jgi:large subunit ribosomal protein L23